MNILGELPLWGQTGLFGLVLGILIYVVLLVLKGDLVTRKSADQIQKTSDMWQSAWQATQQVSEKQAATLERLVVLTDTLDHFLTSLPVPSDHPSQGGDSP